MCVTETDNLFLMTCNQCVVKFFRICILVMCSMHELLRVACVSGMCFSGELDESSVHVCKFPGSQTIFSDLFTSQTHPWFLDDHPQKGW